MMVDSGLTPPINPIVFINILLLYLARSRSRTTRLGNGLDGCLRYRMLFRRRISPLDPLQVENKDSVQHRDEQQGDHRRHTQSADLSVTKRLPQRSARSEENTSELQSH